MTTKSTIVKENFVPGTWRGPRSVDTLRAQMADLSRGQRIKDLRESRHLTQEAIAERLGVTLRGYQAWEAGGGIKWDNVKRLATFHKVNPDFVMNGPDETGEASANATQLDRIEMKLDLLTAQIDAFLSQSAAERVAQAVADADEGDRSTSDGSGRKRPAKRTRRATS